MERATIFIEGAGGIGSATGLTLTMQGAGHLMLCDHDRVQSSNLSRQFFQPEDVHSFKAHSLARRLSAIGVQGTTLIGFPLAFGDVLKRYPDLSPDVIVSGVDNNAARLQACMWSMKINKPLVCAGVGEAAEGGYVFVQQRGQACLACHLGASLLEGGSPCPGTPAVLDVLQVVAGYASYAVTSLLMQRPRSWNLLRFYMGSLGGKKSVIKPRKQCPVCHGKGA